MKVIVSQEPVKQEEIKRGDLITHRNDPKVIYLVTTRSETKNILFCLYSTGNAYLSYTLESLHNYVLYKGSITLIQE